MRRLYDARAPGLPWQGRGVQGPTSDPRPADVPAVPAVPPRQRRRFGPERIALLPVLVMLLGALPLAGSSGWLLWLLLVPLGAAVWVLRARVVADGDTLLVCNGLGTQVHPWSAVEGFDVPRYGPVRLLLPGRRVPLTALPRRDLRALLALAPPASPPPPSPPPRAPQPPPR